MKICQVCAVDFTFYHFLLPLARALSHAGHEVVGVCGDGPLAERVRAAGVRVEAVPFSRDLDLLSHLRAYRRLVALLRAERFDMVHVHTPVAAFIGRLAAWRAGWWCGRSIVCGCDRGLETRATCPSRPRRRHQLFFDDSPAVGRVGVRVGGFGQ